MHQQEFKQHVTTVAQVVRLAHGLMRLGVFVSATVFTVLAIFKGSGMNGARPL